MPRARLLLTVWTLAGLVAACGPDPAADLDRTALRAGWTQWVAARDSLFRSEVSPLVPEDLPGFDGIPYFDYDPAYAVPAVLVPSLTRDTVNFPTTTGALQRHVTAGHLVFTLDGVQRRLEAFESVGDTRLFVPFRDATSGDATYGGGRYLDLELEPTGRYALDLNRAYHPYCVYNVSYSCPLPPAENTMSTDVPAGERLP
ncbi:DUF1684 domain-containing protein [Rubrivirga sp. IMCC43871]|uniref:DUF1684 domain-containing protein n=1 Tax=Rubrivirga sp. IMCC43871 TaxID=3391575 RepID=UPI0039901297